MSPGQGAEVFGAAIDLAEGRAAAAGRGIADAAEDLDSIARGLGGGWTGRSGTVARTGAGDAAAGVRGLAGACSFLADVLRVEGALLARAVVGWSRDEQAGVGTGDAEAVRDADSGLAARLREAADSLTGYADPATVACLDLSGSTGDDPREVAALWHSLGPAERDRLARDHPGLGSVAGVSSVARDPLNRARLRRMLQTGGVRSGDGPAAGLVALADHLAEDPGRHLLSLHADGRAVVASADPDGAGRVVTLVPGTGSSLGEIGRSAARADAMCEAAGDASGDTGCVSVAWQGYRAPADLAEAGFSTARATGHADDLRAYATGLDAVEALDGQDAPHTAVGYSYGSTVLGAAAADPGGVAADRMIHVGSPGAAVESIAEQRIDEAGVARAAGDRDVVGVVSRWDPVPWWAVTGLLGERPGTDGFGGTAVDVTEPGSGPGSVRDAHSTYFDRGTVSLAEIGRLIVDPGRP